MTLLSQIRNRKGVTSYVVAQTLGITQGAYIHIEKGRRSVSAELAHKIAEYFGVDLELICSPKDTRYVIASATTLSRTEAS